MNIIIGADHRGFNHKKQIQQEKNVGGHEITWIDVGTHTAERTDYPLFAQHAVGEIKKGRASCAVLLCGTGIGMAIAANRVHGIYAGVAWNAEIARLAREDDNVNVLVIPADYVSGPEALAIIDAWLNARFKEGRYAQRIAMIDRL